MEYILDINNLYKNLVFSIILYKDDQVVNGYLLPRDIDILKSDLLLLKENNNKIIVTGNANKILKNNVTKLIREKNKK